MSEDLGSALRIIYTLLLIAFLISVGLILFMVGSYYLKGGTDNLEQCANPAEETEITGIIMNEESIVDVVRKPVKSSVIEPLSWKVILNNLDTPDVLLSYEVSDWVRWAISFILKMTLVSLLAGFFVPIIAYKVNRLFGGQEYESERSSN